MPHILGCVCIALQHARTHTHTPLDSVVPAGMMLLLFALFFWIILSLIKGTRARCAAGDGEASLAAGLAHGSCGVACAHASGGRQPRVPRAVRPARHQRPWTGQAKPAWTGPKVPWGGHPPAVTSPPPTWQSSSARTSVCCQHLPAVPQHSLQHTAWTWMLEEDVEACLVCPFAFSLRDFTITRVWVKFVGHPNRSGDNFEHQSGLGQAGMGDLDTLIVDVQKQLGAIIQKVGGRARLRSSCSSRVSSAPRALPQSKRGPRAGRCGVHTRFSVRAGTDRATCLRMRLLWLGCAAEAYRCAAQEAAVPLPI